MTAKAVADLHEVYVLLDSLSEPSDIRRFEELEAAREKVLAAASTLAGEIDRHDLHHRFRSAVRSMEKARRMGRAHRRNPLGRPLSHMRFALNIGSAQGSVHLILAAVDPGNAPALPET
ncbi:hypothetical protein [Streptomyces calidiresistens]|uniref:Uncharacterized protein n=1 Tax=Streptomyces calidiresistens TaxID=1485586 RepID=A0A7W3T3Z4_9ACTN|nr:hypothetical protein [Streptomyces calidiresistens]MBB0230530.1 hypothetical protein [Streptomyces calidiresistens]